MRKITYILVATAALFLLPSSNNAIAEDKVADPVGLFGGNGRYWIPRNGDGKGIIKLYRSGRAIMLWNDQWTYNGTWTQSGNRVTTNWEEGAPVSGNSWTIRENDDPEKEYTASSSKP
jgi:hypothetical protein